MKVNFEKVIGESIAEQSVPDGSSGYEDENTNGVGIYGGVGTFGIKSLKKGVDRGGLKKDLIEKQNKLNKSLDKKIFEYKNLIENQIRNLNSEEMIDIINIQLLSYNDGIDLALEELKKDVDFFDEVFPDGYETGGSIPEDVSYDNNVDGIDGTNIPIRYIRNIFREFDEKISFLKKMKKEIEETLDNLSIKDNGDGLEVAQTDKKIA